MNNIIFRGAIQSGDLQQLKDLYYKAFYPERVDEFAEILYNHQPNLPKANWLVAEDTVNKQIVSAIALIPWKWKLAGIELKMAEMGIVATLPEYRGKGLMHKLNQEFEKLMKQEGYFVSGIQGIPGFYHKLGYEYAVELNNHIIVPLHVLDQEQADDTYKIRKADLHDIPYLMEEEVVYGKTYDLSSVRSKDNMEYLLTHSLKTECESDIYILENGNSKCCFKVYKHGFGSGLIVTECSETATVLQLKNCLYHLNKIAKAANKPYLSLNMHRQSNLAQYVINLGAQNGKSYAWQMKITDIHELLKTLKSVFNKRIQHSKFSDFTGVFRLDFYQQAFDFDFGKGEILEIRKANDKEEPYTFAINSRWFARIVFGHNSWGELHAIHPDVSPAILAIEPVSGGVATFVGEFMNVLFPKLNGWINLQY